MEIRQIKELMSAMQRTGTKRITFKKDDFEIELEREDHSGYKGAFLNEPSEEHYFRGENALRRASMPLPIEGGEILPGKRDEDPQTSPGLYVTSPMVGTFYASPSPEDAPFIKVGDKIDKETVVCIIEAMKVMNEVKAGVTGVVSEILVENGHPVEFGTKLFQVT